MSTEVATEPRPKTNGIHPPQPGKKRHFDAEFKAAIVARVLAGENAGKVATATNISGSVIRRWVAEAPQARAKTAKKPKGLLPGVTVSATGRKAYSEEFKRKAVARLMKGGESVDALCEELGIHNSMLYHWRDGYAKKPARPSTAKGQLGFTEEQKMAVVQRLLDGELASVVGRELKIKQGAIGYWKKLYAKKLKRAADKANPFAESLPVPKAGTAPQADSLIKVNAKREAVAFLRHAKTEMHEMLQRGDIKEFDQAHLLSMLALNALLKAP